MRLVKIPSIKTAEQLIIVMFSILPLIDMLNGLISGIPIGTLYKLLLCVVLFFRLKKNGIKIGKKTLGILIISIVYIFFSIFYNMIILSERIGNVDYPIKLLFNITLFSFMYECCKKNKIKCQSLFIMIDYSTWVMILCYLVPYALGLGNRIYAGDIGYKGFFIAQNELNVIIVIMTFFTSYKLSINFRVIDFVKLCLIILCGVLLNTKTTLVACLIAVFMWLFDILKNKGLKVKVGSVILGGIGFWILKDRVISAISNSVSRFQILQTKHYEGSILTGILSGRNYYLENAWSDLQTNHTFIRSMMGNGFCSDVLIEMDLFDVFFYLGLIGAVFVLFFLIWQFIRIYVNCKKDQTKIRVVSYLVIVGLSFVAGHVLFMAMSGCYFILYCCFLAFYNDDRKIACRKEARL